MIKFLRKNNKKIIILILLVMAFNFMAPSVSQASFGGKLFKPFARLICGIADVVIKLLQSMFLGYGDIKDGNIFYIAYSPGYIFSDKVPALNVNFFDPPEDEYTYEGNRIDVSLALSGKITDSTEKYSEDEIKKLIITVTENSATETDISKYTEDYDTAATIWNSQDDFDAYFRKIGATDLGGSFSSVYKVNVDGVEYYAYIFEKGAYGAIGALWKKYTHYCYIITTQDTTTTVVGTERNYASSILQSTIATWYKALRAIALVGLLSVLVYIGIRILISSTGQDKAKYKKMIIDWLAAICILFVLQYIMIFTLNITGKITGVLSKNIIDQDAGTDTLMTEIRQSVNNNPGDEDIFGYTIMYVALVIFTCTFTVHYLKRLVYMAFFTMIAPLIALTYPLDKIKDGQAQAFGMWIREYIFNALIQPVHLLLYYIFIGSATTLVSENPLYAVICLGFMIPAEKFFRKMFGFEKSSSVSQVGAAAGGALVMNAINKMGQKAGQHALNKGSSSSSGGIPGNKGAGVRTSDGSALNALTGSTQPQPYDGQELSGFPGSGGMSSNVSSRGVNTGRVNRGGTNSVRNKLFTKEAAKRNIKGIGRIGKNQLFTGPAIKRNLGALGGVVGAGMGATLGIAAGVATGDFSNVAKYGALGLAGGANAGKGMVNTGFNAVDSIRSGVDNLKYDFQEGTLGEEEAANRKFDREFRRSEDYKKMLKNYGSGAKGNIQDMLNAGITDPTRMNTILKSMNKYGTDLPHAMAYNQLAKDCNDSVLYDDKKLRMFLNKRGITNTNNLDALRQSIIDFK